MFSGASLENLINEAAIRAATRDSGLIENGDIENAFYKTIAGDDRESMANGSEKCIIALHEAGHALASRLLTPGSSLIRISILPASSGAAGYNLCIPEEKVMVSRGNLEDHICILLAGRAAEMLMGGEDALTAGASGDIARATEIAAAMVMELGMNGEPAVSQKVLAGLCGPSNENSAACKSILECQFRRVYDLLEENADALMKITRALIEEETLTGEQADDLIKGLSNESRISA